MPNVAALMARGGWGALRSTAPPITVPAWTCMVTGRDPGELGLYGFRNRVRRSYDLRLASSKDVRVKRIWDLVGDAGKRVASLFVPLTSPPTPLRGHMVSGFLAPGGETPTTFPRGLADELEARFGPYQPDVEDFRSDDLERVMSSLRAMGRQHFAMARHVWEEKRPDLMMMVEMGPDRFHHAFWRHIDPSHPEFVPGNAWESSALDYYAFLDAQIGELLEAVDDETVVMIVSDHGARAMKGGLAINEWLRREGFLHLKEEPNEPRPLSRDDVDWSRTRAWGEGGYYARIFLNVAGREPEGIIPGRDVDAERARLERALLSMKGPDGETLRNRVDHPASVYREARGEPPDLMAYFGDLDYRSIGSVGHDAIFLPTNDTGPDGCNHDWDGIFIMAGGGLTERGPIEGAEIYDVAATVMGLFDLERPPGMRGRDWSEPQ